MALLVAAEAMETYRGTPYAPSVVHCWVAASSLTDERLARLRQFIHRMGRETRQGAVGIVIDDEYLEITEFDSEG